MARRARVVQLEQPTEEAPNGADQIESAEDGDSTEQTTSSSFSVIDKRGDDYVPPADSPISHIEVIEDTPKRRGRPKGAGNRGPAKATPNEIAQAAPLLVGLSNQVVVTWFGPECAMAETEAKFLVPSTARMLARLPKGAADQVSTYTDPFIILVALGLWAARIQKIKEMQAKAKYQTTPFEAARAYGESGTTLGEDAPPIEQNTHLPPTVEDPDKRANNATSAIFQGRNPV